MWGFLHYLLTGCWCMSSGAHPYWWLYHPVAHPWPNWGTQPQPQIHLLCYSQELVGLMPRGEHVWRTWPSSACGIWCRLHGHLLGWFQYLAWHRVSRCRLTELLSWEHAQHFPWQRCEEDYLSWPLRRRRNIVLFHMEHTENEWKYHTLMSNFRRTLFCRVCS